MSTSFKELRVWEKGVGLVENIYALCKDIPETERFNIISQLQRCATSIPANIAEGHAKQSSKDFQRFLLISKGSAYELETFLILVERIYKIPTQHYQQQTIEIQKMISGLINSL